MESDRYNKPIERQEMAQRLRMLVELRNRVFMETFGHGYETCVFMSNLRNDIAEQHKWHLEQFDALVMGQRK